MIEKKMNQEESYRRSYELIGEILDPRILDKKEFSWHKINSAIENLTRFESKEVEELLVKILEMEGKIKMVQPSDSPSAMSPSELLKAYAIDKLTEWTGRKYLRLFENLSESSEYSDVSMVARIYVEKLKEQE